MRKEILLIASLFMLGACSNDVEKDLKSNAEINNAELKITIAKNEDMLVFNSNEDFQNAISKLNAAPTKEEKSTKALNNSDENVYGDMLQTPDISFKKDGFRSLYDYFTEAMNEAENYYDRPGGYEEFKTKYSMLYFPEEGDDYSAYLPVKDENVAKLLNANGEVSINGEIVNLKDINSYQQLIDLGIAATEENYTIPVTRADYPLNELPEVRCNNRRLWVKTEVRRGSSPGVAEEIAILVRFRKKGLFGKWYNYGSTTYLKFEPDGREYSIKDKNSTHEYLWARVFQNGQPVPFQGLCSVKFQGFGAECGGTKYFFRVDL
ncbi:hypothetical protein [uncultured Bacteroides sp.]|uniref:hypothetical protein n=2 Tax=uncultured Bacteroides sp. TaxID=162156 RepID=UPI0025839748|nr:hypothetical protein [uncultured Bacteroides sp.]